MSAALRVVVITASVRDGRIGPAIARWFQRTAVGLSQIEIDDLDLAVFPLPTVISETPPEDVAAAVAALSARLAPADAVVVVTPEYNHSYPASIKAAIDWTGAEWHAKPVAFVSYGGLAGGQRAVEHLRPILSEMHAVPIRDVVSIHGPWDLFDADGELREAPGPDRAAKVLWERLTWWALALREAKERRPFEV